MTLKYRLNSIEVLLNRNTAHIKARRGLGRSSHRQKWYYMMSRYTPTSRILETIIFATPDLYYNFVEIISNNFKVSLSSFNFNITSSKRPRKHGKLTQAFKFSSSDRVSHYLTFT